MSVISAPGRRVAKFYRSIQVNARAGCFSFSPDVVIDGFVLVGFFFEVIEFLLTVSPSIKLLGTGSAKSIFLSLIKADNRRGHLMDDAKPLTKMSEKRVCFTLTDLILI